MTEYKRKRNEALGIIHEDLKNHKEFGSLFQFWKSQVILELEDKTDLEYDDIHNIAISIVKRIAQEY